MPSDDFSFTATPASTDGPVIQSSNVVDVSGTVGFSMDARVSGRRNASRMLTDAAAQQCRAQDRAAEVRRR
jgi:hypothetical protein